MYGSTMSEGQRKSPLYQILDSPSMRFLYVTLVVLFALRVLELAFSQTLESALWAIAHGAALAWFVHARRRMVGKELWGFSEAHYFAGAHMPSGGAPTSYRVLGIAAVSILVLAISMGVVFISTGLWVSADAGNLAWVPLVVMGILILSILPFGFKWVVLLLVVGDEEVAFYNKKADMTSLWKKADLESLELRGKVLRMKIARAPKGVLRESRFLILDDVSEVRKALEANWTNLGASLK